MSGGKPLSVNGWTLFAHPIFLDQLEALTKQVEALKRKDPVDYVKKNATKRLAAIARLAFEMIPQDPARPEFRQGNTLGNEHKHWFRAKFFQQYRLFFRFHAQAKVIVFAWVNDEDTKRAYHSADDAYPGTSLRSALDRQEPRCLPKPHPGPPRTSGREKSDIGFPANVGAARGVDIYPVFRRMLDSGRPPSDWTQLLAEARADSERLGGLASPTRP